MLHVGITQQGKVPDWKTNGKYRMKYVLDNNPNSFFSKFCFQTFGTVQLF